MSNLHGAFNQSWILLHRRKKENIFSCEDTTLWDQKKKSRSKYPSCVLHQRLHAAHGNGAVQRRNISRRVDSNRRARRFVSRTSPAHSLDLRRSREGAAFGAPRSNGRRRRAWVHVERRREGLSALSPPLAAHLWAVAHQATQRQGLSPYVVDGERITVRGPFRATEKMRGHAEAELAYGVT